MNTFGKLGALAAGGICSIAILGAALAAGPTLQNDSFEVGPTPGTYTQVNPGTSISGWTVEVAVDYIGSYWPAHDGGRSIDMNASPTRGKISQTFPTVVDASYTLGFWLSANPDPGCVAAPIAIAYNVDRALQVSATGASPSIYAFNPAAAGASLTDMKWRPESYTFVATSAATTLTFESLTDGYCGAALDGSMSLVETLPNVAPTAIDDTATTFAGVPATVAVLSNDSDPDGGTLSVTEVTQGAHGSVVINADGTVNYTPVAGYVGTDTFTYTISDGQGGSATATITVTVNAATVVTTTRMTGGGQLTVGKGKTATKATWGFEVRCDGTNANLEFQDHTGGNFKLTSATSVTCSDNPAVNSGVPGAGFDTLRLVGTGKWNGVAGATVDVTLVDAGEPGTKDTIAITVRDAGGNVISTLSGNLTAGNQQAHK